MTEIDAIFKKLDEIYDRLFISEESIQNRLSKVEYSLSACQKASNDRRSGFFKIWMTIISAFITAIFAAIVAVFKK